MRFFLFVSLLLLFTLTVSGQESRTITTDRIEGIICANYSDWEYRFKGKRFWTPTKEQVLRAEDEVVKYMKKNSPSYDPGLSIKLPKYKRQYVGIIVGGHKRIFCNFYCSNERLTNKPFFVEDGGDCYFQVEYDLDDHQCYNLQINGEA